jgi:hypothetical protein
MHHRLGVNSQMRKNFQHHNQEGFAVPGLLQCDEGRGQRGRKNISQVLFDKLPPVRVSAAIFGRVQLLQGAK